MNHAHQETLQSIVTQLHHVKTQHEVDALRVELDDFEQRVITDAAGLTQQLLYSIVSQLRILLAYKRPA